VLRIAAFLQQTLPPENLAAARQRISEGVRQRREIGNRWMAARLPCPLLVDERCSVYPVRPLTCRGFNSSDARRCRQSVTERAPVELPVYQPQLNIATFVLDGLRAGLHEAGLGSELLELTAALDIALTQPSAAERWLAGETVFVVARLR
jgi:hypothetical protein